MLAKPTPAIPTGDGWMYEPKWDGFRALVFRDGPTVQIQSRDLKPLNRYFPELEPPLLELGGPDARFVLDGEVVIARVGGGLDFDALLIRIHPAESRVRMLAAESPASFVAFDCLADGDEEAQHGGQDDEAGDAEPRRLEVRLALGEDLPEGRGPRRQAESEEVERGERGDRAAQDERQEGQRGHHRVREHVAEHDHPVPDAERARRAHVVEVARAEKLGADHADERHPAEE